MEGAACECSFLDYVEDKQLDKLLHHRNMVPERKKIITEGQAARQAVYETSAAQRWRKVVSRYSRLSLTREIDIFPAISGIAEQMNREIKDKYVAGLWEKNLPIDLLWEVRTNLQDLGKLQHGRGPTESSQCIGLTTSTMNANPRYT